LIGRFPQRYLPVTTLAACLLLLAAGPPPAAAQSDDRLENWQRRVLRALERDADRRAGDQRQSLRAPDARDPEAAAAAAKAQARYGGRPLAVARVGDRYRVRLLLDDGRVVTVDVRD
jgi:hypothetical protein